MNWLLKNIILFIQENINFYLWWFPKSSIIFAGHKRSTSPRDRHDYHGRTVERSLSHGRDSSLGPSSSRPRDPRIDERLKRSPELIGRDRYGSDNKKNLVNRFKNARPISLMQMCRWITLKRCEGTVDPKHKNSLKNFLTYKNISCKNLYILL